jgi:hypothetical protein
LEPNAIGEVRRNFGVREKAFMDCMEEFPSRKTYFDIGDQFEIFSGSLDSALTFGECCLQFIIFLHELRNGDGTPRYKSGHCRKAQSILKKIGLFAQKVSNFKVICPQIDVLLKQWEKKESEPKKAAPFTEDDVEAILNQPITHENISKLVR